MHHDIELAYIGIEIAEPTSLSDFLGDVIGLTPGEPAEGGALTWRNDNKAHRVIVTPGPTNDAAFLGFEALNASSFDAVVSRLGAAGYEVAEGTDEELKTRRVDRLVRS